MISISKMTDYATLLMSTIALSSDTVMNAAQLAEQTSVPLPTVSKLLKMLVRCQLLQSIRGAQGGYHLSRPADAISVVDIIEAIDGPLRLTVCSQEGHDCRYQEHCGLQANWRIINQAIANALRQISLKEMAASLIPKERLKSKLLDSIQPLVARETI